MTVVTNPAVDAMQAYVPGEQPSDPSVVKLNTNECPYPVPEAVIEAVTAEAQRSLFQKYPDPSCSALRTAIAKRLELTPDNIIMGNGSDEILRMLFHTFIRPGAGDRIAMLNPTYVLYQTLAQMYGVEVEKHGVNGPGFELPESFIASNAKIVFLPNPNPPIGTFYRVADLECLAAADSNRLVVIDEAYVDFAPGSALEIFRKYENVIISRTFSKSYSLAGLRVGFAIAHPSLIRALDKIKDSYNLNRLSQAAALAAWNSGDYFADIVQRIKKDRAYLVSELVARGFKVHESHGNFVFARKPQAGDIYRKLKDINVLVRYFDSPELKDGLRITIGTREELDQLLRGLDSISN